MRLATNMLCLLLLLTCHVATAYAAERVTTVTLGHGTVAIDNTTPAAGDVVTITVTPYEGYAIEKRDILAVVTIAPGSAHAPAMAPPAVGYYLTLDGEQPGDTSLQASYTFIMPEEPLNVEVTAQFREQTVTGLSETFTALRVTSVQYLDINGRVSKAPFPGINIIVTTYADGSNSITRRHVR